MGWVRDHLDLPTPVEKDEVPSSATGSPVVRIHLPLRDDRHRIAAEVEDQSVRVWPSVLDPTATDLVAGPSIWVGLRYKADDSIGFNWNYLKALAPTLRAARNDWKRNARPKDAIDHAAWNAIGAPPDLGYGFGRQQARNNGECMFGARYPLPPEVTLGGIAAELHEVTQLLLRLSTVPRPD